MDLNPGSYAMVHDEVDLPFASAIEKHRIKNDSDFEDVAVRQQVSILEMMGEIAWRSWLRT
jgi:hypothetical protein